MMFVRYSYMLFESCLHKSKVFLILPHMYCAQKISDCFVDHRDIQTESYMHRHTYLSLNLTLIKPEFSFLISQSLSNFWFPPSPSFKWFFMTSSAVLKEGARRRYGDKVSVYKRRRRSWTTYYRILQIDFSLTCAIFLSYACLCYSTT